MVSCAATEAASSSSIVIIAGAVATVVLVLLVIILVTIVVRRYEYTNNTVCFTDVMLCVAEELAKVSTFLPTQKWMWLRNLNVSISSFV